MDREPDLERDLERDLEGDLDLLRLAPSLLFSLSPSSIMTLLRLPDLLLRSEASLLSFSLDIFPPVAGEPTPAAGDEVPSDSVIARLRFSAALPFSIFRLVTGVLLLPGLTPTRGVAGVVIRSATPDKADAAAASLRF